MASAIAGSSASSASSTVAARERTRLTAYCTSARRWSAPSRAGCSLLFCDM